MNVSPSTSSNRSGGLDRCERGRTCYRTSSDTTVSDLTKGQTGADKTARNPVKIIPIAKLKKPEWIRVKAGNSQTYTVTVNRPL